MANDDITSLLRDVRGGSEPARAELFQVVYRELLAMARRRLPSRRGVTLDTTALVHETYLKLFDRTSLEWQDRRHFFAVAAMAMRQIVVDHARRRAAQKRGGGLEQVELDDDAGASQGDPEQVLAVDQAMAQLAVVNERYARIVEMRYFAGFTDEEIAETLEISDRTVRRDWRLARALLHQALHGPAGS